MKTRRLQSISQFIIVIVFILQHNSMFAQQEVEEGKITPPSPVAYELGKYGQIPVGLFTGTPRVNIPLYTYRTNNLTVPLSLSYNSNGIKVDELGSNVGLGWSLNVGGVISRIVRDLPDEEISKSIPVDDIHNTSPWNKRVLEYFFDAGNSPNVDSETDMFMFNFDGYSGKFVFGKDHQIVMLPKQALKIEMTEDQIGDGFRITTPNGVAYTFTEKEFTRNRSEGAGHDVGEFYITGWYLSSIKHPKGDLITFVYSGAGYNYIASQSQTLTASDLQQSCPETGLIGGYHTLGPLINARLNVSGKSLTEIHSNIPEQGKVQLVSGFSHPEVGGYNLVSAINVLDKNSTAVETFALNYLTTTNNRVFLKEVVTKDPNKKYQMDYIDPGSFPKRWDVSTGKTCFSQDHWGYYNGKINTHLFPKGNTLEAAPLCIAVCTEGGDKTPDPLKAQIGLLNKITYPTKGYNEFSYEGNTYRGTQVIMPPVQHAHVDIATDNDVNPTALATASITNIKFAQNAVLTFSVEFNNCQGGPDPIHNRATLTITDLGPQNITTQTILYISNTGNTVGEGNSMVITPTTSNEGYYGELKADHNYEIKLSASANSCVRASADLEYFYGDKTTVPANLPLGGLRIKQVKAYDPVKQNTQTTNYFYGKKETPDISTGQQGPAPFYLTNRIDRRPCSIQNSYVDFLYTELGSSSLNSLYSSMDANSTNYQFVTVSYGTNFENGGEEHEFILDQDAPANPIYGDPIRTAPWTNIGIGNGNEKNNKVFKKNAAGTGFVILKEVANIYTTDPGYLEEVFGYQIQKRFSTLISHDLTHTCTSADMAITCTDNVCTAVHKRWCLIEGSLVYTDVGHAWTNILCCGMSGYWTCTRADATNVTTTYNCSQCPYVGYQLTYTDQLDNLNITECKSISQWNYLSSSTETNYDLNGQNGISTTTNYFYDNPAHLQLTRSETTDSKGNVLKTKTYYPDDVTSVSSLPGGDLASTDFTTIGFLKRDQQFQIGVPVQTETYRGTDKLSTTRTVFQLVNTNMVLLYKVQTLKGDASTSNVLRDKIIYHSYDAFGNPTEISKANDVHTSYLWGYNYTLPVAQIQNATYTQVTTALGVTNQNISYLQTLPNSGLETELNNKLRGANLPQAQVTTFTYDPLIGVRTVTKPNGVTAKYEYDSFNRLHLTRDLDNNILQRYQYHYAVTNTCPADLNADNQITLADRTILLNAMGTICQYNGNCPCDLNGDGKVDSADLTIFDAITLNSSCP